MECILTELMAIYTRSNYDGPFDSVKYHMLFLFPAISIYKYLHNISYKHYSFKSTLSDYNETRNALAALPFATSSLTQKAQDRGQEASESRLKQESSLPINKRYK